MEGGVGMGPESQVLTTGVGTEDWTVATSLKVHTLARLYCNTFVSF